jgi:hypothetical protein
MGQQHMIDAPAWRRGAAPWLRRVAACALALTLGLGQAFAGSPNGMHEGGQGADKARHAVAFADGGDRTSSTAKPEAPAAKPTADAAKAKVTVDIEEEGIGTDAWSRTVTRTRITRNFITSVTRSKSFAIDEDGNRAIARAVARARAPNNVAAVRNGAGSVTARASVDVAGNGVASADAGGSIGIARGGVKVETWGRTSAEVF